MQHHAHVVDGLLHLFVIAFVGLGDQLVDLAVGDLRQDAVAFADGQQNGIQHPLMPCIIFAVGALELVRSAPLAQRPFPRRLDQPHDLLRDHQHLVSRSRGTARGNSFIAAHFREHDVFACLLNKLRLLAIN